MGKKILGILVIGLVFTLAIPIGSARPDYESKLFAFGFIQIYSIDHEIKGFVIFGINDGEVLILQKINIKYDGATPIFVGGPIPLWRYILYNPVG